MKIDVSRVAGAEASLARADGALQRAYGGRAYGDDGPLLRQRGIQRVRGLGA